MIRNVLTSFAVLVVISLSLDTALAQDCFEPSAYVPIVGVTGNSEGQLVEIEIAQSWAFVLRSASPPVLVVYNLHDPELPVREVEVPLPVGAQHLRVEGNRLYFISDVGYYARLHIWSVNNPLVPVELGTMDIQSQVEDLDVEGNLLALCTAHFHLSFIDVTIGEFPVWLSDISPSGGAIAVTHVDLYPTFAVCNYRGHYYGIAQVSILDPQNPVVTFFENHGFWLRGFQMEDDGTHGWASDSDFNLYRVDLTAPGPTLTLAGSGGPGIFVADELVITHGAYGLIPFVYEQNAEGALSLRDRWPWRIFDLARKGQFLVLVRGADGLFVRKLVTDVPAPYVGAVTTLRSSHPGVSVGPTDTPGFMLELNGDHNRLFVVDYSNPEYPLRRGAWTCDEPRVAAARGQDVVLAYEDGVRLLSLGLLGTLTDRGFLRGDDDVFSIIWDGDLVWLGSSTSDLWLYDMSDSTAPVLLFHDLIVGGPRHLFRVDQYLIVGAFLSGFYVFDVSTPEDPVLVVHFGETVAESMAVWGDHVYTGSRFAEGVEVISLADVANPVVVRFVVTPEEAGSLHAHEDQLWVGQWDRLSVFELVAGIPAEPARVETEYDGVINFANADDFTAVGGDHVYLMRRPCSSITAAAPPEAISISNLDAAPNPFNASTLLSLSLTNTGYSHLAIYDLRGRLVRDLVSREVPAGRLTVSWDGCDERGRPAPTGTYVARLASRGGIAVTKLSLVK